MAAIYAKETKEMFDLMVKAILESLEIDGEGDKAAEELKEGSQLVVVNCYPPCPQPELTLGMPPHSDYGFVTLLLQDDVEGLQIMYRDEWVTVDPIPGSFVVNVGDHLEVLIILFIKSFLIYIYFCHQIMKLHSVNTFLRELIFTFYVPKIVYL